MASEIPFEDDSVLPCDGNIPNLRTEKTTSIYPVNKEPAKVIPPEDVSAVKTTRRLLKRLSIDAYFHLYDKVSQCDAFKREPIWLQKLFTFDNQEKAA